MSIDVVWDNDAQTTVRYDFDGPWRWEDIAAARATEHAMIAEKTHRVDIILDMTKTSMIPDNPVARLRSMAAEVPENTGITVIVGANLLARSLFNIFTKVYRKEVAESLRFVQDLAEARAVIAAQKNN